MLAKEPSLQERIDPRVRRTRQLLMKAFQELLAEKSLEAITVQDVADRATVNRATFYAHFEDKYDLIDQAFEESFAAVLHKKLLPGFEFSPTNLQLLIQTICEFLEQLHHHCVRSNNTQLDSHLEAQVRLQLHNVLLQWVKPAGNTATSRPDAELRATVASWAIYGACLWWNQSASREPAQEFARQVLPMIMTGLDPQRSVASKASSRKPVARLL
jgi:AcrR family transcriptional regulator